MSRSKKWLAACLAGVMAASLMGCGSSAGTNKTDGQGAGADGESVTGDGDTAMAGMWNPLRHWISAT